VGNGLGRRGRSGDRSTKQREPWRRSTPGTLAFMTRPPRNGASDRPSSGRPDGPALADSTSKPPLRRGPSEAKVPHQRHHPAGSKALPWTASGSGRSPF
jgi:hypothetical protein